MRWAVGVGPSARAMLVVRVGPGDAGCDIYKHRQGNNKRPASSLFEAFCLNLVK